MKSKVDKLDIDKKVPVPIDLSKLSDVVENDVVKKDVCNAKIWNIEDKIPNITNVATNTTLNAKINEVKFETPSITNLATTTALNAKINEVSNKTLNPIQDGGAKRPPLPYQFLPCNFYKLRN